MKEAAQTLTKQIQSILERNRRVEIEKAWETSWTRRVSIAFFTYLTIGLFMSSIDIARPWTNAIVPSLGFILSTLSLPVIKNLWLRKSKSL
jgi:hypothetical protein